MQPVPWFLATRPSLNPDMAARPRIAAMLDEVPAHNRAVLVAAPSGFGKTVAVSQWADAAERADPGRVAWLTLAEPVNNAVDVLRGILTALLNAVGAHDESSRRALSALFEAPSAEAAMTALSALQAPRRLTIVIDDFQLARDAYPDDAVVALIENGPQWLRYVLLSTDPASNAWMRLRIQDKVSVIGAADLAFDRREVAELAARAGARPTDADIAALVSATNGWPAAVRLSLVAGGAPVGERSDVTGYIQTAVLARLRPDLADFALRATVCSRVDEPLADVLSGQAGSGRLLEDCVAAGLFIERIGSRKSAVYQWHSLFAEHCREILRRTDPQSWLRLNRAAGQQLRDRYPLAAVEHAIRGGDRAGCDIIADHWLELLLQSRATALDHACVRLMRAFGERSELLMIRSCCRAMAGDDAAAAMLLDRAEAIAAGRSSRRLGFIADLTVLLVSDDRDAMAAAAGRVERALPTRDVTSPRLYACALFVLGWADSRLRRGLERGSALLEAAVHECAALGLPEVAQRARQNLAFALSHAGQFDRADEALRIDIAGDVGGSELWLSHDGDGIERFTAGWIQLWRGELEPAAADFLAADAGAGVGYPDTARMCLAFAAATLRDPAVLRRAEAALTRMPDTDSHGVPWRAYRSAAQARLAEVRGERSAALSLAETVLDNPHLPMVSAVLSGMSRRLGEPELAERLARQALAQPNPGYITAYATWTLALLDWQRGRRWWTSVSTPLLWGRSNSTHLHLDRRHGSQTGRLLSPDRAPAGGRQAKMARWQQNSPAGSPSTSAIPNRTGRPIWRRKPPKAPRTCCTWSGTTPASPPGTASAGWWTCRT